jgi:hypothetical protein
MHVIHLGGNDLIFKRVKLWFLTFKGWALSLIPSGMGFLYVTTRQFTYVSPHLRQTELVMLRRPLIMSPRGLQFLPQCLVLLQKHGLTSCDPFRWELETLPSAHTPSTHTQPHPHTPTHLFCYQKQHPARYSCKLCTLEEIAF